MKRAMFAILRRFHFCSRRICGPVAPQASRRPGRWIANPAGAICGLLVLILLLLILAGCGGGGATPEPGTTWELTVVRGEAEQRFTLADLQALPSTEIQYESKETGTVNTYKGVMLRVLLQQVGADLDRLAGVEVEAEDGYLARYGPELAASDDVVLVYEMDGGPLPAEMGVVRAIALGQERKMSVKFVSKITIRE